MFDWKAFFNDFAEKYYSVPHLDTKEHIYALQNYLLEKDMLVEDVDYAIKTLLGEELPRPKNAWNEREIHFEEEKARKTDKVYQSSWPDGKAPEGAKVMTGTKGGKYYIGDPDTGEPAEPEDVDSITKKDKKDKKDDKVEKNKELNQKKAKSTEKEFNKGKLSQDGVEDEEYLEKHGENLIDEPLDVEEVASLFPDPTPFPKKYVKVLTRLLNTKKTGLKITDVTDSAGGGTPESTTGELIAMMVTSIDDDKEAVKTLAILEQHAIANADAKTLVSKGWVKSAGKVRDTIRSRYDRLYGKGKWTFKNAAWDIEEEVEALGIENYKRDKGFSTDVYFTVEVGGKTLIDEVSLKKDKKANLLTATTNRVSDILVRGKATSEEMEKYEALYAKYGSWRGKSKWSEKERDFYEALHKKYSKDMPEDVNVAKVVSNQTKLHKDGLASGSDEIRSVVSTFNSLSEPQRLEKLQEVGKAMNQKTNWAESQLEDVSRMLSSLPTEGDITVDMLKGIYKDVAGKGDLKYAQKLSMMMMNLTKIENPEGSTAEHLSGIIEHSHGHSKAVAKYLLKDDNARAGLLKSIREDFPLKSLMNGEENMILGDLSMDQQTLLDVFGVPSFDEVQENLSVRDEPSPPSIVYRVKGQEDVAIAEITNRPDGIGYGTTWKLIMGLHGDMAKELEASKVAER